MSVQELNNWAVMNLAMEDKGLAPSSSGKGKGGVCLIQGMQASGNR
jgi:hypothetical protein